MKCEKVHSRLAGYLDDALVAASHSEERSAIREHLEGCAGCREELQRYRKMSMLLSRAGRALPPSNLAVRIKVAAAQAQGTMDWASRWQRIKDRVEILVDNVFGPLTVPATGGLFSAILIFVFVLHIMLPGITVQADPNAAEAWYLLGRLQKESGRAGEAEESFHQMRRVLPWSKWKGPPG